MIEAARERRLRRSAVLVMLGLATELVSLTWHHPTAFIVFVGIGGSLMAAGMIQYLSMIVRRGG
jgi:fructoselysine-6-P-deglycase FrlB-like protein